MIKVNYILSNNIDYSLLICDDAGYGFAENMGWRAVKLDELSIDKNEFFVIDNRVTAEEADKLEVTIRQNSDTTFLLKIVDPYIENKGHYYYEFLSRMSGCANTILLSVYTPVELTAQIKTQFRNRFIHLPYPYLIEREVEHKNRSNRIIITGSLNEQVYPYRYAIWKNVTRSWLRLFFFSILKHPGYAEFSDDRQRAHSLIGVHFVEHLSQFKYMLLCATRCKVELMKFYECAYAGCMPVGESPSSYPDEIAGFFRALRATSLVRDTLNMIISGYNTATVFKLREFLRKTRSPAHLNNILENFLLENSLHTS